MTALELTFWILDHDSHISGNNSIASKTPPIHYSGRFHRNLQFSQEGWNWQIFFSSFPSALILYGMAETKSDKTFIDRCTAPRGSKKCFPVILIILGTERKKKESAAVWCCWSQSARPFNWPLVRDSRRLQGRRPWPVHTLRNHDRISQNHVHHFVLQRLQLFF